MPLNGQRCKIWRRTSLSPRIASRAAQGDLGDGLPSRARNLALDWYNQRCATTSAFYSHNRRSYGEFKTSDPASACAGRQSHSLRSPFRVLLSQHFHPPCNLGTDRGPDQPVPCASTSWVACSAYTATACILAALSEAESDGTCIVDKDVQQARSTDI